MNNTENNLIIKELEEIKFLTKLLDRYISEKGIDDVAKELYFCIWVYDYNGKRKDKYKEWLDGKSGRNVLNKQKSRSRIDDLKYLLENLSIDKKLFSERHDYLCLFTKELELLDSNQIPKRNIYSYSELREYDPAKNAKNILKHGISFRDLTDNSNSIFGDLVTHTYSKGEYRKIYFSRIKEENSFNYVMSICALPESDFDLVVGKIADKILPKNSLNIRDINKSDIAKIIQELKSQGILDNIPRGPALRIISARYFTEENYEEVIAQAIQDENLEPSVLDELRKMAISLIQQINCFSGKS